MPAAWDEIQLEEQFQLTYWVRCSRCGYQSEPVVDIDLAMAERSSHYDHHQQKAAEIRARIAASREGGQ